MIFHFYYVEDYTDDIALLQEAIDAHNDSRGPVHLKMTPLKNVEELRTALDSRIGGPADAVLADVNYLVGTTEQVPWIDQILDAVLLRTSTLVYRAPIPVIAYTGRGPESLQKCLNAKDKLFDIWDKTSATPRYVTWRLTTLALTLSRLRPDVVLQRRILDMMEGPSWHGIVRSMPLSYAMDLSERGQIEGIGGDINKIGTVLGVFDSVNAMWKVMMEWEALSRGVSPTIRGHARHVVNVFWIGYYLLNHPLLSDWFVTKWKQRVERKTQSLKRIASHDLVRAKIAKAMGKIIDKIRSREELLESLNNTWFFAAVFHDVAGCVAKYEDLQTVAKRLIHAFGCTITAPNNKWLPDLLLQEAEAVVTEYGPETAAIVMPMWLESMKREHPDHGIVAAAHIRLALQNTDEAVNAHEAARAIALHNLVGELDSSVQRILNWSDDPLACLLIFCDQIQTWDRERGDEGIFGPDSPSRAQLNDLDVAAKTPPLVTMGIEYVIPEHLQHHPVLFDRAKRRLEAVLMEKPNRALARLGGWPFDLDVTCTLSGQPIEPRFTIRGGQYKAAPLA